MNNWDIKLLVEYIANKEQSGNMLSASEFEDVLNEVSFELLRMYLANTNQPNRTMGSNKTYESIQSISVFMEEDYKVSLTSGVGTLPSDMFEFSYATYNYINNSSCGATTIPVYVQLLANSEFDMAQSMSLLAPSYEEPVMKISSGTIYVSPSIQEIYLNYIREPRRAVIALDPTITDYDAYDATNSIELEWSDKDKYKLIDLILKKVGVNLKDQVVAQYAQMMEAKG
jgi:hypothetical protein